MAGAAASVATTRRARQFIKVGPDSAGRGGRGLRGGAMAYRKLLSQRGQMQRRARAHENSTHVAEALGERPIRLEVRVIGLRQSRVGMAEVPPQRLQDPKTSRTATDASDRLVAGWRLGHQVEFGIGARRNDGLKQDLAPADGRHACQGPVRALEVIERAVTVNNVEA